MLPDDEPEGLPDEDPDDEEEDPEGEGSAPDEVLDAAPPDPLQDAQLASSPPPSPEPAGTPPIEPVQAPTAAARRSERPTALASTCMGATIGPSMQVVNDQCRRRIVDGSARGGAVVHASPEGYGASMANDHFTEAYRDARPEDLPWFHAQPDEDLVALFDEVLPAKGARVLDLGAGPAVHAIALAARGHHVVAIDAVAEARAMALGLAAKHGVTIDYQVGDAIRATPKGPFDLVFDRGFMHTLEPGERPLWRSAVVGALRPGGCVVFKCFDVRPPRDFGPPGLTARDVVDTLGAAGPGGLGLELLRRSRFPGHAEGSHAAWTVMAKRIP